MKRTIAYILTMALLVTLTSCSVNNGKTFGDGYNNSVSIGDITQFGGSNWRVLDIQDGKMLIISEDILENRLYDDSNSAWEASDIRAYLNGEFISQHFTKDESALILETFLADSDNPVYVGNGTCDNVFLLSFDEADRDFSNDDDRIAYIDGEAAWWWLRSCGVYSFTASCVASTGDLHTGDYVYLDVWASLGVRPALWLCIDK